MTKKYLAILMLILPLTSTHLSLAFNSTSKFLNRNTTIKRSISNQTQLGINVDEIEDVCVYTISNVVNNALVWDIPTNNFCDGALPVLNYSNNSDSQRFIVHKEAKYDGKMYYTIRPLNCFDDLAFKTMNSKENEKVKLGKDDNTNLEGFLSNKFAIEKQICGYAISTGASSFEKYVIPKDESAFKNNLIVQKNVTNVSNNRNCLWNFLKTDTLGIDVKNKINISGTDFKTYNVTIPMKGEYIIETEQHDSSIVDTYLELYKGDEKIAYNDDISRASNRFSRITYKFTEKGNHKVRVRGYTSNDVGNVFLTLRPKNALYFAAVYDYDKKNNNDRPGSLKNVIPYMPNYYIEIQGNRGKSAILETAANGKKKMNCDYFLFSGHGYDNISGVEFYNGISKDGFYHYNIPNLDGTKIAIWMTCHGARNYFKGRSQGEMTSMAYESVKKGADYSLGYVGEIYDTTQRAFPENFFELVNSGKTIPDAIKQATEKVKSDNWRYWNTFGKKHDDFDNPIIYKKGDSLKLSCGNGNYENSAKNVKMPLNNDITLYVDNTKCDKNDCIILSKRNREINSKFYKPQYLFKTNYLGREIELGFDCNSLTGEVTYFNVTLNSKITSYEFENMMGEPSENVIELIS